MRTYEETKRIWFTSDLHFLHPKIIDICNRPISIEDHDEWLLDRFNSLINKKDEFYILGDVSMGSLSNTIKILDRLHGKKFLILGNHDKNLKNCDRFELITQIHNFNFQMEDHPNMHIVLCHYPLASWDRKVFGSSHLYGHMHGRFENSGLSFDVGVDANNYLPLNLENVYDKITKISMKYM